METGLIFGGVLVSLLVEFLKGKFKTGTTGTLAIVAILSLVGGIAYTLLTHFGMWESFVGVLVAAGAFYAFIIKTVKG